MFSGERLKAARNARKLSQSALALRIGAHPTSVSDWERGENVPSGRHLANLCRELGVAFEQLCDDEDEEEALDPVAALTAAIDRYVDRKIAAAGG